MDFNWFIFTNQLLFYEQKQKQGLIQFPIYWGVNSEFKQLNTLTESSFFQHENGCHFLLLMSWGKKLSIAKLKGKTNEKFNKMIRVSVELMEVSHFP